MLIRNIIIAVASIALLSSCANTDTKQATLHDIDRGGEQKKHQESAVTTKSDDDIRSAYENYLKHASKNDKSRINALTRLAELEFELSEEILKNNEDEVLLNNQLYNEKLDRTISLLNTTLQDYPGTKGNDKALYQLAKAYDQKGEIALSYTTMEKLASLHPKSKHYIEIQFRLAEAAFSKKRYTVAEDKYTEVIGSRKNNIFYEKSLYKRGWSRFKQGFHTEAIDDFSHVINLNKFDDYESLTPSKKGLFDEYFRAIGLSFSYMDGAESLNNYFSGSSEFKQLYYAYRSLSELYLKEDRNSDAVNALNNFAQNNPYSPHAPIALLKTIEIWKSAGFAAQANMTLEAFYTNYQPNSTYWNNHANINIKIFNQVQNTLKAHILTITANHHQQYLKSRSQVEYLQAERWYKNYLKHYRSSSRKDNVHFLYASLLAESKQYANAFQQYELAAYDENIIINKNAAYETILLSAELMALNSNSPHQTTRWIDKLIHYSTLYSQQYATDTKTISIISHASETAYKDKRYNATIELAALIAGTGNLASGLVDNINALKAHSYIKLNQYQSAEDIYRALLKSDHLTLSQQSSFFDGLALSIYYQGKMAADKGNLDEAIQHYARVNHSAPKNPTAATGLYNAITLSMTKEYWQQAIGFIKRFQDQFPHHQHSRDVSKKLTIIYLNSEQNIAAARELEKLSKPGQDQEYSIAALWKAGELYEANKDYHSAIRTYTQFSETYTRQFLQQMEAMMKLVVLNRLIDDTDRESAWHKRIIQVDKMTTSSLKTERTMFIASTAALHLAEKSHLEFSSIKLVLPLKRHLKLKKAAMQKAVNLYARAASYSAIETTTEATHQIGNIFNEFSRALLQSERPKELNKDELEQYQFLLEDQSFPFEEKAIEFYETNLAHITDGIYDEWVKKSHDQLRHLFPVRYQREAMLDGYINVLH
ncbi:MAG: tetratricopeptide repeat protein [Gammaproteobacteria bacterium]|nr:tetratricopeptide repeat protein [Gammaproteobacteria bacterium]